MEEDLNICDCVDFYQDFVNLCMSDKGDGILQWKMFEELLTKYVGYYPYEISLLNENDLDEEFLPPCTVKICFLLAQKLEMLRRCYTALSTLLLDLMAISDSYGCVRDYVDCLWDFEKDIDFSKERETFRVTVALRGNNYNSDSMKLLLNFGLISTLPADTDCLQEELEVNYVWFMKVLISHSNYNINESDVIGEALELVRRIFLHYEVQECCKRMFLAVRAVFAVHLKLNSHSYAEESISCLRMYFAGTPDAFPSILEVRSVLYPSFKLINSLHLFDEYCEEFGKLMPECPAKKEPRNLTHLARCQIRRNLKASHLPLPSAVDKLHLPDILKRFLLGEILDISRSRVNTSSEKAVTEAELEFLMSEHEQSTT